MGVLTVEKVERSVSKGFWRHASRDSSGEWNMPRKLFKVNSDSAFHVELKYPSCPKSNNSSFQKSDFIENDEKTSFTDRRKHLNKLKIR